MGAVAEWTTATAVAAAKLNEPFWISAATYDGPGNRLDVTVGPGRADFSNPGGVHLVNSAVDQHVYIAAPATGTTYYLFLKPDGSFRTSSTATPQAGEARIGSVTTGAALVDPITRADLRGILPVPSSSLTTAVGDIKALNDVAVLGASALAAPADHQHGVPAGTVAGLDADKLDTRHAGTASGNVPVSTGVVCTDLNADKADGYHVDSGAGVWTIPISRNSQPRRFFTAATRNDGEAVEGDVLFNI